MLLLVQLGLLFFHLLSWAALVHVLLTKRDPRSALGWAAVLLLVPALGLFLYLIFGISRTQSRAAAIMRQHAALLPVYARPARPETPEHDIPPWAERMERLGHSLTRQQLCGGNTVEPLYNGNMAYPRMLEAIGRARHHVLLTTYIFNSGEVSDKFCAALADAARRGCHVRVLVDGVGRLYSLRSPLKKLAANGIMVALFLPPSLFPPNLMLNLRNHRKILVCDDMAFTGGMNIADYHVVGRGRRHEVQDVHFQLTGPIVAAMYRSFYLDWGFATRQYEKALPKCQLGGGGSAFCRVVLDGPGSGADPLNDLIAGSIGSAISSVWIMTPYFLPTREIMAALRSAAQKGLDVRVILPAENNLPYVHWAAQRVLPPLLEVGVRIFYQKPPFAHTKLLCIDDYYCHIGSANYDSRSLR
ncbi:MAG: phospholipase D-like domain-containing protein, partial [Desulfovibrionaceae bacterium]|nr:phospholipase D-like domain-containing protein [Desulfovibrionaceae bacterium]